MPPASSSSSPTSGCSPRTRAPGTSSSARPTRPRPTAASSASASARAMPRSDDGSGSPAATGCPSGSSARASPRSCGIDEEKAAVVVRAYQLAATGSTDWEVAAQTGLAKTHVSEVLTNPIYAGRLRTGEVGGHRADRRPGALVDGADDARATADPDTRSHREGRLRPAPAAAPAAGSTSSATSAATATRRRPARRSWRRSPSSAVGGAGTGTRSTRASRATRYPKEWYEDAVGELLGQIGEPRRPHHDRGRPPLRRGPREAGRAARWHASTGSATRPPSGSPRPATSRPGRRRWRGSTRSSRWPDSHGSTSAWRPTRSSPTCARCRRCGPTQDPKDARRSPRRCSPSSKWRATRRCDTNSHPTPSSSVSSAALPAELEIGGQMGGFGRGERI